MPCLIVHALRGQARWIEAQALTDLGWCVFSYDPRGVGASEGEWDRGPVELLAQDLAAACTAMRQRPEVDPERIVVMGVGDAGWAAARSSVVADGPAGVVLASAATDTALFPDLWTERIADVISPYYYGESTAADAVVGRTLGSWRQWLFDGEVQVSLVGRRASLRALRQMADVDLAQTLTDSDIPMLILHGTNDMYVPVAEAKALAEQLAGSARSRVAIEVFEGLDHTLGADGSSPMDPQVQRALGEWLADTFP